MDDMDRDLLFILTFLGLTIVIGVLGLFLLSRLSKAGFTRPAGVTVLVSQGCCWSWRSCRRFLPYVALAPAVVFAVLGMAALAQRRQAPPRWRDRVAARGRRMVGVHRHSGEHSGLGSGHPRRSVDHAAHHGFRELYRLQPLRSPSLGADFLGELCHPSPPPGRSDPGRLRQVLREGLHRHGRRPDLRGSAGPRLGCPLGPRGRAGEHPARHPGVHQDVAARPLLARAKARGHRLVLDVQDTVVFKRRIKNKWLYDALIFKSRRQLADFGRRASPTA